MKIASVSAQSVVVNGKVPISNKPLSQKMLVAQVETDDGIVGVGLSRDLELYATRELISTELAPYLMGRNPLENERIWKEAAAALGVDYKVAGGVVARALSAIDQALWDIKGKAYGQPVFRLLGGATVGAVPTYITFGLNLLNTEELVELAKQLVSAGHDKLKYQVVAANEGRDIMVDVKRLRAVRDAIGYDVMLIVDGNARFDFIHAREILKHFEELKIGCFDHPVTLRDPRLLADLRRGTTVPLAARAYSGSVWDNRDLILSGGIDVFHTNVLDSGGYTGALKVAHMAELFHLPLATGGAFHSQNGQIIAGVANGWMTEYHLGLAQLTETMFVDPPKPEKGMLPLLEKPGLGLELDYVALREYAEW